MRFFVLVIFGILLSFSETYAEESPPPEGGVKKLFRVTGYYSPLPNQAKYVRGSYEADIRLNGRGTNGADGTEVFPGMIAAPKTYPFGTKIFLPGLGLGTVHDRGGAIVSAGNRGQSYDRIDVWMGSGEDGLSRALAFGVRVMEGVLYPLGSALSDTFSWYAIPPADLSFLPDASFSPQSISAPVSIQTLQKSLRELGLYSGEENGVFDERTESALVDFQLSFGVITSEEDFGAGNYGPKTKEILSHVLQKQYQEKISEVSYFTEFFPAGLSTGSSGESVAHLQEFLKRSGFLESQASGKFDEQTEIAVKNFQLVHGVVQNPDEWGAGVFGFKTQEALFRLLAERKENTSTEKDLGIIATNFGTPKPLEEKKSSPHNVEPNTRKPEFLIADFSPIPSVQESMPRNVVAGSASKREQVASAEFLPPTTAP